MSNTQRIKDNLHIMVDLETMGQGSNAAVVAIGMVAFDQEGVQSSFYEKIDLRDAAKYGDIDPDTILWWMKQSDEARAEITADDTFDIGVVAAQANSFIVAHGGNVRIWGNGADFDNVILSSLFKKMDISLPWKFWNNRCYRTMKSLYRDVKMDRKGTAHNALDDALSQANHLLKIVKTHGIQLK